MLVGRPPSLRCVVVLMISKKSASYRSNKHCGHFECAVVGMTVVMGVFRVGASSKAGGGVYPGKENSSWPFESVELRESWEELDNEAISEAGGFQEDGGEREDGALQIKELFSIVSGLANRQAAVHGDGRPSSRE